MRKLLTQVRVLFARNGHSPDPPDTDAPATPDVDNARKALVAIETRVASLGARANVIGRQEKAEGT